MSIVVDERVVEMQFNNRQFESGVQTTISTLEKLRRSLNLTGAYKGLEQVETVTKNLSSHALTGLSTAVETVQYKFSALEIMGITALQNITNSAINTGKRIVSALTIDPVKSGFSEYETQINAVQTILANTENKGSTLDDVTKALDELNKYADMTIYNFTEMTRNIGTFTAAGVDLDTSVQSIKGIANLAAISGSSSQQASTAMYQLSQALSSGRVALQDWNSIVNAGMGGQVFQDALKRTATVMGTDVDAMIEKYGSFRESLTQGGWLTAEVLNETLGQFAGAYTEAELISKGYSEQQAKDILKMAETATNAATKVKTFTQLFDTLQEAAQSGWTQSWEIIVGDFEEAKTLLTSISDTLGAMINASSEARNAMLESWKELGGRTVLIEAAKNAFEGIMSVITPIKEAFRDIFPHTTGQQLLEITERLRDFTACLKLSDEQSDQLKRTFKGLFAILDIVKQAFAAVWNGISPLLGKVGFLSDGILSVSSSWGDWLVSLDETIKKTDIFNKAVQGTINFFQNGFTIISTVVEHAYTKFKEFLDVVRNKIEIPGLDAVHNFIGKFHTRMTQATEVAGGLKQAVRDALIGIATSIDWNAINKGIEGVVYVFQSLWNVLKTIGSAVGKVCGDIGNALAHAFDTTNFDQVFDFVNGGILATVLIGLKSFMNNLIDSFDDIGDITANLKETLDTVRGCFEAYQQNLQAKTLLTIAAAIAVLAGSILIISTIDSKKLTASLGAVTVLFADLMGSMMLFSKIGNLKGVTKTVTAMIGISTSVLILAAALKSISSLNTDELTRGLAGVIGLTATIVIASKALSNGNKKVMKGATSLVIFAAAIKVLASACADLAKLSWDELGRGLTGVGVLMAEVSVFLNTAKFGGKAASTATGMVIMAAAIKVLASACADFKNLSWEEIGKGLVAVGALLTELAVFTKLTANAKHVVSTGTAMVLLGASMKIFASAMNDFKNMTWDEIGRGLTAMTGALVAITAALNFMPKNMVSTGTGLTIVAASLLILSNALKSMGGMSWEEIGKGMVVLGSSMLILAAGLSVMNGTLAGSAAMIIAAGALAILAPTLMLLGTMSWESIGKGLLVLAGAFAVIGVAGLALAPLVPVIISLAGSFALIGVGTLAIGAGLLAIGTGLAAVATGFLALAGVGAAGATAVVAALTIIITGVAALIPSIMAKVGEGIITVCNVLINSIPSICNAVVVIVTAVIQALIATIPVLVDGIFLLLDSVLKTLVKYTPSVVDSVCNILYSCLKGIAKNISKVTQAAVDVVLEFIDGVSQKLPDIVQTGIELIINFINGIAMGLENNSAELVGAMENLILALVQVCVDVLVGSVDLIKELGIKLMDSGLIEGILSCIGTILNVIGDIISKILKAIGNAIGQFVEAGGNLISGFVDGIKSKVSSAIETAKEFANDIIETVKGVFDIHSPSRVFRDEVGKRLGEGMILGIKDIAPAVSNEAANMSNKAVKAAKSEFDSFKSWLNDKKYFNELSLADELYAWETAQKRYKNYADQRKEADKEIYRIKQEMEEEEFNNSKKWIDDQLFYEKLKLKDELAAWRRVQKRYEEGTEKRKEADKEVYTLEKEYNSKLEEFENERLSINQDFNEQRIQMEEEYADKVESINQQLVNDIESLNNQYESSVKSRADSIYSSYGLFDAVNVGDDVNSDTLMDNLEGQVDALNNWQKELNKLSGRGVGDEFIKELEAMGPSASKQIEALNSMSSRELSKYVDLWEEKHQIATDKATEELEYLRLETNTKIEQLKNDANIELEEYRIVWHEQMNMLKEDILNQLQELQNEWTSTMGDISDLSDNYVSIDGYENVGKEAMTNLSQGITSESSNVETSVQGVSNAAISTLEQSTNEYHKIGGSIVDGIVMGIENNRYKIIAIMNQLANDIVKSIQDALDIHSPSRVMQSIGQFASLGFINGITDNSDKASQAGVNIAESVKTGLSSAISRISDAINSDIDTQPTIRPVLDLSNIEDGATQLNSMLSRSQAISINAGMNKSIQNDSEENPNSGSNNTYQFVQNNYSPKALSRIDIYRQTKNQFTAMKGALQ